MPDKKVPIGELRKELKKLMIDVSVTPSRMHNRSAIEQMIGVYKGINEQKKDLPPPEHAKKGRKPAREMESETSGEMAVPKKVAPVEREHEPRPKKISKADPPKVADDTPKPKPKRVMTEEHKAKMKAARDAKRAAASTPEKEETEKPKVAKPKKEETPPDAPPKKEQEKEQEKEKEPVLALGPREKKIPVFKMGSA